MPFVDVRGLFHRYPGSPVHSLSDVSFQVEPGEYLAVLGANGSGKSTLVRCLDGLAEIESGSARVGGLDPMNADELAELRARTGLVFQSPADQLVASVVEEDCAFGPENLGLPREEIARRVASALEAAGLSAERSRPAWALSAGQQQRLAVAGALALEPELLLLDEATAMIDPPGRTGFLDLIGRLNSGGTTVIHVTHSMEEALRARRALVLSGGRLAFDGAPAELFERPELEAWSLSRPASLEAARRVRVAFPDFRPAGSAPADFRDELARLARFSGAAPAVPRAGPSNPSNPSIPSIPSDAAPVDPPRDDDALVLDKVVHEYLGGTELAKLALDGASLRAGKGELVALVGATGSGKSSALQHGNALLAPSSGSVRVLGLDPAAKGADLKALRSRAALAVQRPETALFETCVGDDVAFGPRNQGLRGKPLVERVRSAMERVKLPYAEFRDRPVRALSGGEKRRAAMAGVLALEPELLLLDEPCAGLDPGGRESALALQAALKADGRTVAVSTHSMEDATRADRVYVLEKGRVVAEGSPAEVFLGTEPPPGLERPWAAEASVLLWRAGLTSAPGALDAAALADEALAVLGAPRPGGVPRAAAEGSP
ncbi:MAG: ATP-binding cassette domain-containing protein [Spirochaetia bacterium]|nr:ATP-binding cassette domain-containing protein [Spirochaetia bacterium]